MYNIYYIESANFNIFFNDLKKSYRVFSPAIKDPRQIDVPQPVPLPE